MDLSTLKGFNLMNGLTSEGDTSQQRRSSVSSVASGKDTITNHSSKPMANQNKQWELLLAKLEIEFHRSQDVEKELLDLKEAVGKIDKTHDDDRLRKLNALNTSLQDQLDKAQRQLDEYAKKTQLQDEALSSAHKQLLETRKSSKSKSRNAGMDGSRGLEWQQQLEQMRLELVEEKKKYDKDLAVEKSRCNEYEQKCATLERQLWTLEQNQQSPTKASSHPLQHDQGNISPGFVDILHIRSVQILVGVMVAIISALIYISI